MSSPLSKEIGTDFIDGAGNAVTLDDIMKKNPKVIGILFTAAW